MPELAASDDLAPLPDFSALLSNLIATFNSGKTRDLAWRRAQLKAVTRMMTTQGRYENDERVRK